jgi:hypothetical protein
LLASFTAAFAPGELGALTTGAATGAECASAAFPSDCSDIGRFGGVLNPVKKTAN